jgi:hypothetical protein
MTATWPSNLEIGSKLIQYFREIVEGQCERD